MGRNTLLFYRFGSLLVLLIAVAFAPRAAADSRYSGEWHGEIVHNDFEWQVWLHVADEPGNDDVRVSFPEWGMFTSSD
jgi:hypothetical protein